MSHPSLNKNEYKVKQKKQKAIYLRTSRDNKEESDALATHRKVLIDMADKNDWNYDIYEEDFISGEKYAERIELQRMLSNLEKYDAILCMDVDRIGRDDIENAEVKKLCYVHDVQVITPSRVYDFENESDDMMFGLESLFAKWEVKKIKSRLRRGKIDKFREGRYTVGKPAMGYEFSDEKGQLVPSYPEADAIKLMFKLCSEGYGATRIFTALHEQGYKESTGKAIPVSHIRYILKNKVYIGTQTMYVRNKRGEVTEVIENKNAHKPLVDLDTFTRCGFELDRRNNNNNHTRGWVKSSLSGLIRCKQCGCRMTIAVNRSKTRERTVLKRCEYLNPDGSQRCQSAGVSMDVLEQAVYEDLLALLPLIEEELAKTVTDSQEEIIEQINNELRNTERQIAQLDKEDDKLNELFRLDLIAVKKLQTEKKSLQERNTQLTLKTENLLLKLTEVSNRSKLDKLQYWIDVIKRFPTLELVAQNDFLKGIVDAIYYERVAPSDIVGRKNKDYLEIYPPTIDIKWRELT